MAGNSMKPCSGHWTSGNYGNQPVFTDGTTTSPIAQSLTKDLTVPKSAVLFTCQNPTGSSGTVTVSVTGKSGTYPLVAGSEVSFGVAGLSDAAGGFATQIRVVTAASTTANFFFECTTPDGE
jgi:hypothetical protein